MNLLEANYAKMPARVLRQFRERIFFFFLARTKHLSLGPIMTARERWGHQKKPHNDRSPVFTRLISVVCNANVTAGPTWASGPGARPDLRSSTEESGASCAEKVVQPILFQPFSILSGWKWKMAGKWRKITQSRFVVCWMNEWRYLTLIKFKINFKKFKNHFSAF